MAKSRRRYSDDERAAALAALAANGGNVQGTAKQLDLPERTLNHWANGRVNPTVAKNGEERKKDLAAAIEDLAHKLVGHCSKDGTISKASLVQAATALGIAVDKLQALRSGSPAGTEQKRVEFFVVHRPDPPPATVHPEPGPV